MLKKELGPILDSIQYIIIIFTLEYYVKQVNVTDHLLLLLHPISLFYAKFLIFCHFCLPAFFAVNFDPKVLIVDAIILRVNNHYECYSYKIWRHTRRFIRKLERCMINNSTFTQNYQKLSATAKELRETCNSFNRMSKKKKQ